ncbi:zinc finger matrin-type protein 5-like [Branchiostoma floridae x Branchiostoma belcheri]
MGKRYYCDFCDRSFPDNLPGRKKHLQGVQHQRVRKLHYDQFRDAAAILADEAVKKPCKKFQRTGECDYGDNCRFSHMTPDKLSALQEQAEADKRPKLEDRVPTLADWLSKRAQRDQSSRGHTDSSNQNQSAENIPAHLEYSLPPGFPPLHELPPSLHPPPPGGWPDHHPSVEWG